MTSIEQLAEERQAKLQNAKATNNCVNNVLEYFADEKREIEKKVENEKKGFTKNLLIERERHQRDKQTISRLEVKLADADILLNRNSLLITEHKQEIKKRTMQVQQLELKIERTVELHAKQLDEKNNRIKELENIICLKTESAYAKYGVKEQHKETLEPVKTCQHELAISNDGEMKKLQTLVDEHKLSVVQLQKQLQSAENKLKTNMEQIKKLKTQLRKTEKELLISKQLANETMIREMKQVDLSDELKSILSNLTKDTAMIAEELHQKQYLSEQSCPTDNTPAEVEETLEDFSDHRRRLRTIYPQLIERFDAKKLVGWMFAQHAIRLSELQSLLSCRTACEAAEGLLKIILNAQSESIFECFLNALNKTNQQHISSWISYADYDIDSKHVQLIQRHHVYLVDKIDSLHSGLLNELCAREVIDLRDMEQLKAEQTQTSCNEKLLSMLGCKSAQQFEEFLSSLRATGQDFVADELVGYKKSTIIIKNEANVSDRGSLPHHVEVNKLETTVGSSQGLKAQAPSGLQVLQREGLRDTAQLLFTLDKPATHSDGRPRPVAGLVMLHNFIYVVYWEYNKVKVFDCKDHCKKIKNIKIDGLERPVDMVGSSVTSQLFISQMDSDVILRVTLNTEVSDAFLKTGHKRTRLSLVENRLLVTSRDSLLMFDVMYGERMKKIALTRNIKRHEVWHAIESDRGSFYLCHGLFNNHRVSEIDSEGREIRVFESKQQLGCVHLALDSVGRLLITDWKNRVVLLNERLEYEKILLDKKHFDYKCLVKLDYNKNTNRLTVGLYNGHVMVFRVNV